MFTQLPKALLYEEKYKKMTNDSKVLYSFLVDRVQLSLKNNYIDDLGRVYIKCSEITMSEILNKSEKTIRKYKNELIKFDLLEQADAKQDKTKYYVKQPIVTVSKLEDYIDGFLTTVNDRTQKEIERNKEYRLRQAENRIVKLKDKKCNGKNDRSIENTGFEGDKSLKPLQSLATVKTTACDQSKLPYSNTDTSNTEFSMYVCTGEPTEEQKELLRKQYEKENYKMLTLVRKHGLLITNFFENFLKQLEESGFDYELFEQVLYNAVNKKVNNLEGYIWRTIKNLQDKGVTNRYEYDLDVEQYVFKNCKNGKLAIGKDKPKQKPIEKPIEVSVVEEVEEFRPFVPHVEYTPVVEVEPTPVEEEYVPSVNDRVECILLRKQYNLQDEKYFDMNLPQLKAEIARLGLA